MGSFEGIVTSGTTQFAEGWVCDPDFPGTPSAVQISVANAAGATGVLGASNTTLLTAIANQPLTTSGWRDLVAAECGGGARHGFRVAAAVRSRRAGGVGLRHRSQRAGHAVFAPARRQEGHAGRGGHRPARSHLHRLGRADGIGRIPLRRRCRPGRQVPPVGQRQLRGRQLARPRRDTPAVSRSPRRRRRRRSCRRASGTWCASNTSGRTPRRPGRRVSTSRGRGRWPVRRWRRSRSRRPRCTRWRNRLGNGLQGTYFTGVNSLKELAATTRRARCRARSAPSTMSGTTSTTRSRAMRHPPHPELTVAHNFGARFEGQIVPPVSGNYTFSLETDGAAQIFVNGNPFRSRPWSRNTTRPRSYVRTTSAPPVVHSPNRASRTTSARRWSVPRTLTAARTPGTRAAWKTSGDTAPRTSAWSRRW